MGKCDVSHFSDGEISVSIHESVRGSDVFVVQSISTPVNDNLMELLIMMDAFKRALPAGLPPLSRIWGMRGRTAKRKPAIRFPQSWWPI